MLPLIYFSCETYFKHIFQLCVERIQSMSEKLFEQWQKNLIPQACSFYQAPSPDFSPVRERQVFLFDGESNELASLQKEQNIFQDQFNEEFRSQYDYFFQEKENSKIDQIPSFEVAYDFLAEDEQIEKEKNEFQNIFNNLLLLSLPAPIVEKKEKKFRNKNYCHYIMVYAFRAIVKSEFEEVIARICQNHDANLCAFKNYYQKQLLIITGYKLLKQELIIKQSDDAEISSRKQAFQSYLIWYLDNLATKDILLSKKKNLKTYLKYKNFVMSYYVRFPAQWNGNEPEWNEEYQKK